jgi:hypothetical protein
MSKFDELRSTFQMVQRQFEEAETLEERQRLVGVSQQIIREADCHIAEFRRAVKANLDKA